MLEFFYIYILDLDEDLDLAVRTIKEADEDVAAGVNFLFFQMISE